MKLIIGIIISFFIGSILSSLFTKRRGEKFYVFRMYQLYQEGKTELIQVVISAVFNTILGGIIVALITAFIL